MKRITQRQSCSILRLSLPSSTSIDEQGIQFVVRFDQPHADSVAAQALCIALPHR
jgi:hypothetical protein